MPQWVEWVTFVLASVGAVLGVLSTWAGMVRDKPRLKVRPVWVVVTGPLAGRQIEYSYRSGSAVLKHPGGALAVEVINYGYTIVYLAEVGICPQRVRWFRRQRRLHEPPERSKFMWDKRGHVTLPCEIAPGASVVITGDMSAVGDEAILKAKSVYALTQSEHFALGTSDLIKQVQVKAVRGAKGQG